MSYIWHVSAAPVIFRAPANSRRPTYNDSEFDAPPLATSVRITFTETTSQASSARRGGVLTARFHCPGPSEVGFALSGSLAVVRARDGRAGGGAPGSRGGAGPILTVQSNSPHLEYSAL